uniref:DNA-directed RNA polymerase n=1 Tax=Cryptoglena skujai TaxID=161229 RepID=A0A0G3SFE0_9EUGL|nr:RNA polymerase beta'' subunit [Cryptoglena skujai]AKL39004.1 RNA polymerase beta'' subunit [Cryptoglena skujai]
MKNKKLKLICNKTFDKKEIKKLIEWFIYNYGSIRTNKLLDNLKVIGFNSATTAGISLGLEDLKIPLTKQNLISNTENYLKKINDRLILGKINFLTEIERITDCWNTSNEILKKEVIKNFRQTDLLNPVYMMTFSGARGNLSQIKQLVGMRGLMSDSQGEIINLPIKSNLKEGLKTIEYFISCYGARKGLVDTALKTANSGYLTRRLIYVGQEQTIKQPNCNTNNGILITNSKNNKKTFAYTKEKLLGKILARNIINKNNNKIVASKNQDICKYIFKKLNKNKINKIYIRSPLTCRLNTGTCQICYGWNLGNGRMIELGENIGIIAAQSIGEPGTQLTMRTFHTGGIFSGESNETINAPFEGIIKYNSNKEGKKIKTQYGDKAYLTLKDKNIYIINEKNITSKIKIPQHTIILIKPNQKVFFKQTIAEITNWKNIKPNKENYTTNSKEIRTQISGKIFYEKKDKDLLWVINGTIFKIEHTYSILKRNFSQKIFISLDKKNEKNTKSIFKPRKIKRKNVCIMKLFNFIKIQKQKKYSYSIRIIDVKNKKLLTEKNSSEKLIKIKSNSNSNTRLGKIINKNLKLNKKIINKNSGQIKQQRNNQILITKANSYQISNKKYLINKNLIKKNSILSFVYYKNKKTEDIVQGLPKIEELLEARKKKESYMTTPHEKLKKYFITFKNKYTTLIAIRKSVTKIQKYLIDKVSFVYTSQNVNISEKHMEVIIKQMTSRVIITEQGDSNIISGEIIELNRIEKINQKLSKKVKYEPLLIGITKLSLSNQSFISEASFQETTRILTKSAIEGKIDWLFGLKENIILGKLIPIGTGFNLDIRK